MRTWAFLLFCLLAAPLAQAQNQASANDQNLTAEELAVNARALYMKGDYTGAAGLYNKFITDFGQAKEAQEAIRQMRYPLAMCLVHLQKFSEGLEAINAALKVEPPYSQSQMQELLFWKGVCEMQEEDYEAARKSFAEFIAAFPPGAEKNPNYVKQAPVVLKVPEALLLIGSTYLLEEKFKDAAAFYKKNKPSMNAINRGRAAVLELYALLQADDDAAAMQLVMEEFPQIGDLIQIVTFQTLTLELGSRFLEKKEFRKAIVCLQRIWSSERLLRHQEARLEDLTSRLEAAEANPQSDPYIKFLLGQMIPKVQREVASFRKIENFDSALRLRLATAYQGMQRYREAALIMEAMLADMPPDKIVEAASGNLVQCWGAIERWPKVIEAAKTFVAKFPKSANVPLILYMEGIAEEKDYQYDQAVATFDSIVKKYPASEYAPRAQFMKGFSLMQAEKNKEAIAAFEDFAKSYPTHEMAESAAYWRGVGFSLDKQYARSREVLDEYLERYQNGAFRSQALFRKAYSAQQAKDFRTSITELKKFTQDYPAEEETAEARILLADAYMNEGMMLEGIAALKGIPPENERFYAEAVFKTGKAYKLMEEYGKLREHMVQFQTAFPRNPRVAEAIYWIGWTYRQEDQLDKARDVYWDAIAEYGDDATIRSVEDLFPALSKLYKGEDGQAQYFARLRDLREESLAAGKETLAMRTLWAQGSALKRKNPAEARELFLQAAAGVNVQTTNPLLMADFAEALQTSGKEKEAEQMYRDLVKWNPRAPQKDQALAALGMMELQRGNEKAALKLFDRFERETMGSRLFGQVLLAKAELLEKRGHAAEARQTLEKLLANQYSSGQEKARALFAIGEMHMKEGKPQLAIPYYQRIYVMYGRWRDWVAKAYYRSGEAFEKLKDELAARRTYQELTSSEDLAGFQETALARERLKALGGPLEEPQPSPTQG